MTAICDGNTGRGRWSDGARMLQTSAAFQGELQAPPASHVGERIETGPDASLPERFFVAYGHSLLAGTGTRAGAATGLLVINKTAHNSSGSGSGGNALGGGTMESQTETASIMLANSTPVRSGSGSGGGSDAAGRETRAEAASSSVPEKRALPGGGSGGGTARKFRGREYGRALEVFHEGLRRFPASTRLLYGSSLAMQVLQ